MPTYTSRDQMDDRLAQTLVQLMESQAYRELAAAHLFGFGLRFAPELRWIKFMTWHIREEVEHFEAVARMYRSFTGADVTPVAMARLTARPVDSVDSWFEGLGERLVVELVGTGCHEDRKQRDFVKWLRHGLRSFGRPGTEGNRYALAAGIKRRDSGAVMQDYLDDIKPAVKACGLAFPSPAELGLDTPPGLNWSLDGGAPASAARWSAPDRLERAS